MEKTEGPTFSRLVFGKAYANTKNLFADKVKDTIFGGFLALPGGLISLYRYGLPVEMESGLSFAAATFGPIGVVVVIVFLWNLWLAPCEISYEAWRSSLYKPTTPMPRPAPSINWTIWKKRTEYTIWEFSMILAKDDPSTSYVGTDASAYCKLIMEGISKKQIPCIARYYKIAGTSDSEIKVNARHNNIKKSVAIEWAKSQSFDVSHIE
jgi:hypothetical protein